MEAIGKISYTSGTHCICLFVYLFAFLKHRIQHIVQVISSRVVLWAEETSTYSWCQGFGSVNCQQTASSYQLFHSRSSQDSNSNLRSGRQECYHSAALAPEHIVNPS